MGQGHVFSGMVEVHDGLGLGWHMIATPTKFDANLTYLVCLWEWLISAGANDTLSLKVWIAARQTRVFFYISSVNPLVRFLFNPKPPGIPFPHRSRSCALLCYNRIAAQRRRRTITSNSCIDSLPSRFVSMARNSSAHLSTWSDQDALVSASISRHVDVLYVLEQDPNHVSWTIFRLDDSIFDTQSFDDPSATSLCLYVLTICVFLNQGTSTHGNNPTSRASRAWSLHQKDPYWLPQPKYIPLS